MKTSRIIISTTDLHEKSEYFCKDKHKEVEPWSKIPNVLYDIPYQDIITSNKKFIFPIYTAGSPYNWLRSSNTGMLEFLDNTLLEYASTGKVLFYIFQGNEGFSLFDKTHEYWPVHEYNYFKLLHDFFSKKNIKLKNVIYHTSNLLEKENYKTWCDLNNINDRIFVISNSTFAEVSKTPNWFNLENIEETFESQYTYKIKSKEIKLFSCLNRRDRAHRSVLIAMLDYYNLLDNNDVSHPKKDTNFIIDYWKNLHPAFEENKIQNLQKKLPLTLDYDDFEVNWANVWFRETYLRTWISVITETLYQDEIMSVFVSEKIFKPMIAMQPFLLVGQPRTLEFIRKMGFRTFDRWWDESYDTEFHPIKRMQKVCEILLDLKKLSKKEWLLIYREMYDVLLHNQNFLMHNSFTHSKENESFIKEFFK
jgi:hypothetical protein